VFTLYSKLYVLFPYLFCLVESETMLLSSPQNFHRMFTLQQINNVCTKKYTKSITNILRTKNTKMGLMGFVQN
jgi:hypothetical protein